MKIILWFASVVVVFGCSKKKTEALKVQYNVTYEVYSPSISGAITYNTIPNDGEYPDIANNDFTKGVRRTISLKGNGLHKARYYVKAESTSWGKTGSIYVTVYQDGALVDSISAYGTVPTEAISMGNLPK